MGNTYSFMAIPQWYYEGNKSYGRVGYEKEAAAWQPDELDAVDASGKHYVVTGANAGIGYAVATRLLQAGGNVHMLCRNAERGEAARKTLDESETKKPNATVTLHVVDMSEMASVRTVAPFLVQACHGTISAYIHNAGVMLSEETRSSEGKEVTMATMLGGSHLLLALLTPSLTIGPSPGRVINVSSAGMYTVKLNASNLNREGNVSTYDGTSRYSIVKRLQVALTERWAKELGTQNVGIYSMHPGWAESPGLKASLPGFHAKQKDSLRSSAAGADTIAWLALSPSVTPAQSGNFFFDRKAVRKSLPLSCTSHDPTKVEILWNAATAFCACEQEIKALVTTTTATDEVKLL